MNESVCPGNVFSATGRRSKCALGAHICPKYLPSVQYAKVQLSYSVSPGACSTLVGGPGSRAEG